MRIQTYKCDGCGETSDTADGWFEGYIRNSKDDIDYAKEIHYCVNCQDRMQMKW